MSNGSFWIYFQKTPGTYDWSRHLSKIYQKQRKMALTPFFFFLKFSFFLPIVFFIIRHYIRRLMEAVMGRRGLTSAVQSRKFSRADFLRAGGSGKTTAMLHPAMFTGAAGRGQEALSHSASLIQCRGLLCYLSITPAQREKDHQSHQMPIKTQSTTHTQQGN